MNLRTGKEEFVSAGKPTGLTLQDFWQFQFSNIYDLQEYIAEFLVAKALGLKQPHNRSGWTLYDIKYRGKRIEVKETGYYYSWQKEDKTSDARSWSITKAHDSNFEYKRQNDVYVFCLNKFKTRRGSYPLELKHWEFYIVPTEIINKECPDQKSISLR